MTEPQPQPTDDPIKALEEAALDRAMQALRLASASVPHLSGLVRYIRIRPSWKVPVAAVAASGLTIINPEVFAEIPLAESAFVLAHELMHLALDTHGREGDAHPLLANFAHDYIINDILQEELERAPPLGGLEMSGAREKSLEHLIVELSKGGAEQGDLRCWTAGQPPRRNRSAPSSMSRALEDAGLVEPEQEAERPRFDPDLMRGDVLPGPREPDFEPELSPEQRQKITQQVRRAAAKAASLATMKAKMDAAGQPGVATEPQRGEAMMRALRDAYHTPWELALQRWMDAVAPGDRTYSRPSRRGAERSDVVLPGRRRDGWTLHVVLDTSGSMVDYLPKALGALAMFCEASGVADIHVVQCDAVVTSDLWVEPQQLADFKVAGFGYSDMSPALHHLVEDPEVTAVLVLTDGYIGYPDREPPYRVLWALLGQIDPGFKPAYGEVIRVSLAG